MSENTSYGAMSVLETENQADAADNYVNETHDMQWTRDDLTPLVTANANVLVRCHWMQGAEMTLGDAMRSYPNWSLITEENQDIAIAAVLELLANPVVEMEEPAEGSEPEEDEHLNVEKESAKTEETSQKNDAKAEVQKVQGDSGRVDTEKRLKIKSDENKHLKPSVNKTEKKNSNVRAAEAGAVANIIQSESNQPSQGAVEAEGNDSSSNSSADIIGGDNTGTPEVLNVTSSIPRSSARESVIDETRQEFIAVASTAKNILNGMKSVTKSEVDAKQQILTFEIPETDIAENTTIEAKLAPDGPQLVVDQEIEPLASAAAMEAATKPEFKEISSLDLKSVAISDETAEFSDEKIEVNEDEPALTAPEHQTDTSNLINFGEEEVLVINHLGKTGLEYDEPYIFSDMSVLEFASNDLGTREEASISEHSTEPNLLGQMESASQELFVQTSLTIDKIENSLIQLTEHIETSQRETTEMVYEILDRIIEASTKYVANNDKGITTEAEAQEGLKELFTELLDKAYIDHTPELVESLVHLALKQHLAEEIENLNNEEKIDETPPTSATHEIINKILVALSTIKKAIAHASTIGKSALQLYIFDFAMQAKTT